MHSRAPIPLYILGRFYSYTNIHYTPTLQNIHYTTYIPTLPTGYTAYRHEGWGAEHGEAEKNSSWGEAIARRQEESVHNVKFVPFSLEAGGVWGPAAKKFFKQCASQADNQDRDVDLYHWSSAKFESTWRDTISVLVARGRAQVGVHSAKSDWSRRILDFAYMDYDDQAAHHE